MVDNIDRRDPRQVYDEQADAFANKAPNLLTWEFIGTPTITKYVKEYLPDQEEAAALDIGSASGRVVELLMNCGINAENITGVEISPEEVKIAEKNIPEATFLVGDIAKVELSQGKFDLATSYMVWEFLDREQLDKAFKNVYEALKPGGIFIYGTTHPDRYKGKYGVVEEGWVKTGGPWGGKFENWYRDIDTFIEQTKAAGFEIETTEEIDMPKEAGEKYPDRIKEFNTFGAPVRFFVVARKPS